MQGRDVRDFSAVRDGLVIRGETYPGDGAVMIISHGFLSTMESCREYALAAARWGYTAVIFDFCGGAPSSSSDGRSEDMTVFTEVKDLEAVISFVKKAFPARDIVLMGLSQGGFVSALAAAGRDDISSLVLLYPAFCIPDDSLSGDMLVYRFDPHNIPGIIGEEPMRLGRDYALTMQGFDWEGAVSSYRGKVLILHGTADGIVDIRYSRRAEELYADARLTELPGASHGFSGDDLAKALGEIKRFLGG